MIKKLLRKFIKDTNPLRLSYHKVLSAYHAARHGFPAKKLVCIGITGTDGKTTTSHMLTEILEAAGYKTACLSTQQIKIGDSIERNCTHMTTMGRKELQNLFLGIIKEKCTHVVVECSSQALAQSRLFGVPFQVVALTNISNEHIDYHQTFANYRREKGKLFAHNKVVHVLNASQEDFLYFQNFKSKRKIRIGKDLQAANIETHPTHSSFTLKTPGEEVGLTLNIPARFNIDNALIAAGCALGLDISLQDIKQGLESIQKIPGRTEEIKLGQDFRVFLDFAVTPQALEAIYRDLKEITPGKLIGVFGCTGNRDQNKRTPMGKIAATIADTVIQTTDEPYHERAEDIAETVEIGINSVEKANLTYIKELDRLKAIRKALEIAKKGDTIVITGMGDFDSRVMGRDESLPWDEREIIQGELKSLMNI